MNRIAAFLLCLVTLGGFLRAEPPRIADMGMAKDWCDEAMLDNVEGVWEFVEDNTDVLIRRSAMQPNTYEIIVVSTPDTRLTPGDCIGYLKKSASPDKFEMGVYRTKPEGSLFKDMGKCLAQLNEKNDAITVKGKSVKFSLGSRWLLPAFWRMIRISTKNPLDNLPKGLVRVYPEPRNTKIDYL